MKPISVEFQAFGPYEGKEFVDFEALSKSGLFLIDGKTGSGKTMILDAITFALYGQSSGANRDDLKQLRCSHCDPKVDTYVKFIFEEKGKRYSFERKLAMKRKNLSEEFSAVIINNNGKIVKLLLENCKGREMTKKAEEIIGLTFDQFKQVIILPQGKFEQLLTSDSGKKEEILAQIFDTGKWADIADRYFEKAKAEKDRLTDIQAKVLNSLKEDDCKNLEELEKKISDLQAEMNRAEDEFNKAEYKSKKTELNNQKALASDFDTLSKYDKTLSDLKDKDPDIERDKAKLQAAETAEGLKSVFDALDNANGALNERTEERKIAEEKLKTAQETFNNAKVLLEKHKEEENEYTENKTAKTELDLKKEIYRSLKDIEDKLAISERKKSSLSNEADSLEKKERAALDAMNNASDELNSAEENEIAIRSSYMSNISGQIAKDLKEGDVCPVCGNTHHPKLAKIPEGCADAMDLEKAEKVTKNKKLAWETAQKAKNVAEKALNDKKSELAKAETELAGAQKDAENAKKSLVKGINSLEDYNNEVVRLAGEIQSYEEEYSKLSKAFDDAKQGLTTVGQAVYNAEKELGKATSELEKAKKALQDALAKTSFKDESEAKDAMLDAKDMNDLREDINGYRTQVDDYTKLKVDLVAKLDGKTAPDAKSIDEELSKIEAAEEEYNTEHGKNIELEKRLREKYKVLSKEYKEYEDGIKIAQSNFTFANLLRGTSGVSLQRYVLGIMFSSVIHSANEMLKNVAGGRYTLFRTSEKTDNGNKRGLDLKVMDSCGGSKEGRSVSTLSGGEKFLASLALSIGLASIAKTGGVDIEGIFIDEGFGTLDEDCIGDAINILDCVQKANGLVGIISHVELLRSTIFPQVQVKVDDKKASHIEIY